MSTLTTNYKFTKPLGSENIEVSDINNNSDLLDAALKIVENKADSNTAGLASITTQKLIADINGTSYLNGQAIDYSYIRKQQSVLYAQFYQKMLIGILVEICCCGDSLTYGHDTTSADIRPADPVACPDGSHHVQTRASISYPEALQEYLRTVYGNDKVNVINRGYSGDYLGDSYTRWYTKHDSDVTILMYGTNDASASYVPADIRGNIEDYINWYEQTIIREILWGNAVVILTPPKLMASDSAPLLAFSLALKTMADKYGVPVVDSAEFTSNYPSTIYSDGTHFNASGYRVFASKVSALFIGDGLQRPYMISDGSTLLTRPTLDSVTLYGGAIRSYVAGGETPNETDPTTTLTCSILEPNGGIIYSFYTEEEDIMVLPFYYSDKFNLQITLDFNTTSPRNTNDYVVEIPVGLSEILAKQVLYTLAMQSPLLTDLIKPSGDVTQPTLIRISEKGWHTIKIETTIAGGGIVFNSLAFMNFRNFSQEKKILKNQLDLLGKGVYSFQTSPTYTDTTVVPYTDINLTSLLSALRLSKVPMYWLNIPLKMAVYNYDNSILEYAFVLGGISTDTNGYTVCATPNRYNLIATPTLERTITGITYSSATDLLRITYGGATNRATTIKISR